MGGGSGSQQQPQVITPGQAAQAAVGTAGAGEQMSIANQPVEQYGNLATMSQLGGAETQTQTALQNQAALQSAQAQQAIQSQVDPQAFAQRQIRMAAANKRLGQLTGINPSQVSYTAPGAFNVASLGDVASLSALGQQGRAIASNLSTASVDKSGSNPQLVSPSNPQRVGYVQTPSYLM